jgi:peptidoglycan/xylan/chitin deacetylase (PgdA/CDA1 family)
MSAMRATRVLVTGLALAVLAGCGAAQAPEPGAAPGSASAAPSTSASGASSGSGASVSSPPASSPGSAKPVHSRPHGKPAGSKPTGSKPAGSKPGGSKPGGSKPGGSKPAGPRFGGPANSLIRTGGNGVALTFDDGPDPVQTPRLLDLLKRRHVKATFCLVGRNVAAHPELVRRIAAEGHTLCNHTWRHSLTLGKKKPAEIRADLQRTNDAIRHAVPGARIKYMRAPGGNFTKPFVSVASDLGMTSIYWKVDPRDWDHPRGESSAAHTAKVVGAVKKHVRKGAIVLSHDYRQPQTITAYQRLIPWLQARYKLIALP